MKILNIFPPETSINDLNFYCQKSLQIHGDCKNSSFTVFLRNHGNDYDDTIEIIKMIYIRLVRSKKVFTSPIEGFTYLHFLEGTLDEQISGIPFLEFKFRFAITESENKKYKYDVIATHFLLPR